MQLIPFLERLSELSFSIPTTICFTSTGEYSSIVFGCLLANIKKNTVLPVESLDFEQTAVADILGTLQVSFLGSQVVYCLKNLPAASTKEGKRILSYLQQYNGPHSIIYWVSADNAPTGTIGYLVELPETLTKQQFLKLLSLQHPEAVRTSAALLTSVFGKSSTLSLENAYILLRYLPVVGAQQPAFIATWLDALIVPEKSLFTLSGHLFAKDAQAFFEHWAQLKDEYPDTFWVTFWAEQMWRAAQVVHFMQRKELVEAKKIAFRLPFSFVQRDWRKTTGAQLRQAHDFLYTIDYNLKNGGDAGVFDVFFTQFFIGSFTKEPV